MLTKDKATLDAEVALLGSMLIDERCIGPALTQVKAEDFSAEAYQRVYQVIRRQFGDGETVDPVTVVEELKGDKSVDWYELIKQLMELTPTSANWAEYAKLLRKGAQLRRLQGAGLALAGAADLDDAAKHVSEINANMVERRSVEPMTMEQGVKLFYERRTQTPEYLPWGIQELDDRLTAEPGDYIIIGGATSDGKTALALASAYRQAAKYRVGFFSMETSNGKIIDRLFARVAQIQMQTLKYNKLTEEDYQAAADAAIKVAQRKLEIIPAARMSVEDMFSMALARRYEIIYIDHIQIIPTDPRLGRYAELTRISGDIHTMSQRTGIATVALSQLSRAEKNGKPRPPMLQDLRESGALEQDADIILLLYRQKPRDRMDPHRLLDIAKNKEGELGSIPLILDGATQTFRRDYNYVPPKAKKEENEDRQMTFQNLPSDTEVPFEEEGLP